MKNKILKIRRKKIKKTKTQFPIHFFITILIKPRKKISSNNKLVMMIITATTHLL